MHHALAVVEKNLNAVVENKMKRLYLALITTIFFILFLTSCSVTKNYKITEQSNNMRNVWAQNMIDLMGAKFKNRKYNITFEILAQRFFQGVAYDASYEYTQTLHFDMKDEWDIIKKLYRKKYIKDKWFQDPYGLDDYYRKFPNNTPLLSLVSQDVIKDKKNYEKFKKWFKEKVTKP